MTVALLAALWTVAWMYVGYRLGLKVAEAEQRERARLWTTEG